MSKQRKAWPYPRVLAHRGGGSLAPENTLAAIRCGVSFGFRAIEFDVMLSQDHVPVVIHDAQLGRTVRGTGNVSDYPARLLGQMDAGSWFGTQFLNEPIPTLMEVMHFCKQHHIWMNIEVKPDLGREALTGRIVSEQVKKFFSEEISDQNLGIFNPALPILSSFSIEALYAIKETTSELPMGYLVDDIPMDWSETLKNLDAVALHVNHKNLSRQQTISVQEAGWNVFCYTVNTPERAQVLFDWGVDALCTDRIDLISSHFFVQSSL